MAWRMDTGSRDRGILTIRLATVGGVLGAFGLTWMFSDMAEAYFSGKPAPKPPPPAVPQAAAPVQAAPPVVTTVVHHPYAGPAVGSGYSAPRAPGAAPAAAIAAPPPPACHSTPSHPC